VGWVSVILRVDFASRKNPHATEGDLGVFLQHQYFRALCAIAQKDDCSRRYWWQDTRILFTPGINVAVHIVLVFFLTFVRIHLRNTLLQQP
jgi:hypothetical protein